MSHAEIYRCDYCGKTEEVRENSTGGPQSDYMPHGWFDVYLRLAGYSYLVHKDQTLRRKLGSRQYCSQDCVKRGMAFLMKDWIDASEATS